MVEAVEMGEAADERAAADVAIGRGRSEGEAGL
jgi:hypothetical protein